MGGMLILFICATAPFSSGNMRLKGVWRLRESDTLRPTAHSGGGIGVGWGLHKTHGNMEMEKV